MSTSREYVLPRISRLVAPERACDRAPAAGRFREPTGPCFGQLSYAAASMTAIEKAGGAAKVAGRQVTVR
jgi:hypothetical protein